MSDRELLELAAKAAGVDLNPMKIKPPPPRTDDGFIGYMTNPEQWPSGWFAPLTDDGDALRLAVKLKILIAVEEDASVAVTPTHLHTEQHKRDPQAATRRAIVRAAAEIGRDMP
jgi:hypothetical protein